MRALDSIPAPIRSIVELVLTLVVAIALALAAQAYIVKPYRVPSESMVPTLLPGDRVLAGRLTLRVRAPGRDVAAARAEPRVPRSRGGGDRRFPPAGLQAGQHERRGVQHARPHPA